MSTRPAAPGDSPLAGLRWHRVIDSPLGPITLVIEPAGRLTGLYLEGQRYRPVSSEFGVRDDHVAEDVVAQLSEYFAGSRTRFDLELAPNGTAFQRRVWQGLAAVPYGSTTTYGALAGFLGMGTGSGRAVGAAVGRNPISIVVPCHRVIGRGGSLTGYSGGLDRKRWLLRHEGAIPDAVALTTSAGPGAQ